MSCKKGIFPFPNICMVVPKLFDIVRNYNIWLESDVYKHFNPNQVGGAPRAPPWT